MTVEDDSIAAQQEAMRPKARESGAVTQKIFHDPRFSKLLGWVWATLGAVALIIGLGVYTKLSELNDTLIRAVSQIENQGDQIKDIKAQLNEQKRDIEALRAQVYSLEGKTLRGIEQAGRRGQ